MRWDVYGGLKSFFKWRPDRLIFRIGCSIALVVCFLNLLLVMGWFIRDLFLVFSFYSLLFLAIISFFELVYGSDIKIKKTTTVLFYDASLHILTLFELDKSDFPVYMYLWMGFAWLLYVGLIYESFESIALIIAFEILTLYFISDLIVEVKSRN